MTADEAAIQQMRDRGGKWAAYQNVALDSANAGHLQFLQYGDGCTYKKPPHKYPKDTMHGMGWRYLFAGFVNLDTGNVIETTWSDDVTEKEPKA
jgi:hypothetical protein